MTEPHGPTECAWCPLCQFVARLRAENPESLDRIVTAATAFFAAVQQLFEPRPTQPEQTTPPVQRIDLGGA